MDNREYIQGLIDKGRAAQLSIEDYNQAQVDKMVKTIAKAVYDAREILSKEACEETGLGVFEGKVAKHVGVVTGQWLYMRGKPSVGLIRDDKENCVLEFAKPMGVVCSVTPTTNPTTTVISNAMWALKCANAIIVAPHPRAKSCSLHCTTIIQDALESIGAPRDLVQCIEQPSIELTNLLMQMADVVVATGGPGMVKAAYSSGKPSYGVGQGNAQVVLDRDYTDYDTMAKNIMASRIYDNGVPCTGEQTLHCPREVVDDVIKALVDNGSFEIKDPADIDKIRQAAFLESGATNTDIVGRTAPKVAEYAGVECPSDAQMLVMKVEKWGTKSEPLAREIMCPMLRILPYDKFEEGVQHAKENLLMEGAGHSSTIYTNTDEHVKYMGKKIPVCRIVVNQPNVAGCGRQTNGLVPTNSLGCGSWGNNSVSANLNFNYFYNITRVAYEIPGKKIYTPEEIWAMD